MNLLFSLPNIHQLVCLSLYDYLVLTISFHSVLSAEELDGYINFARSYEESQDSDDEPEDDITSSSITESTFSLNFGDDATSDATSYVHDQHAVSQAEAQLYYAGLPSGPRLLYSTGKEQWSPPKGPEAQRRLKELCEVLTHPIAKVWDHDLGWKVVNVMDAHMVS